MVMVMVRVRVTNGMASDRRFITLRSILIAFAARSCTTHEYTFFSFFLLTLRDSEFTWNICNRGWTMTFINTKDQNVRVVIPARKRGDVVSLCLTLLFSSSFF